MVGIASAGALVGVVSGLTFFDKVVDGVARGDTGAVAIAIGSACYALLSMQAVAFMKFVLDWKEVQAKAAATREADEQRMRAAWALIEARQAEIDEQFRRSGIQLENVRELSEVAAAARSPTTVCIDNTPDAWGPLATGSSYWVVAGQLRGDIMCEIGPGGERTLKPNVDRLLTSWMPRFRAESALASAHYILYVSDTDTDAVRYMLTSFRALQQIAEAENPGSKLLTNRARFHVRKGSAPQVCFFAGEYRRHGKNVPFTCTYHDNAQAFGLPAGLVDDKVYVSFAPDDVRTALQSARQLAMGGRVYTLEQLEAEFGHLVDPPRLDLSGVPSRRPPPPPAGVDHWVAMDDHRRYDD